MSKNGKSMPGVHVPHLKNTEDSVPVRIPIPSKVYIALSQHLGAPCAPIVKVGDYVKVGQKIGDSQAFMYAPIHSSVSGTVVGFGKILNFIGMTLDTVIIETDGKQVVDENIKPPTVTNKAEFINALKESGLVGLGGATFPAHVKYNIKNNDEVDTLIINGAECEPYLTSDYRTMMDRSDDILVGIKTIQKYLEINNVYIAIENNKPKAIEKLQKLTENDATIHVTPLEPVYPKGGEKITIFETTGRVVKEGQLPSHVGCILSNVTSVAVIGTYIKTGMPLVEKCMTVAGTAVTKPQNVIAPIGTPYRDLIAACGGYKGTPKKLLAGGLMMGVAQPDDSLPVQKGGNGLLALSESELDYSEPTDCIRCGRCVRHCPMSLMPAQIDKAYAANRLDELIALKPALCLNCGCCSFICPAKRNLTYTVQRAKGVVVAASKAAAAKAKAEAEKKAAAENK
ncbi:MAG: electron transport complex subunit RsxC [Oscillospiraceae bacterium]